MPRRYIGYVGKKVGGRKQDRTMTRVLGHPRADHQGYVLNSVLAMEKILGRPIESHETVHHIDENPNNNDPGNLMLFKKPGGHQIYHKHLRAFKACGHWDWVRCGYCGGYSDPKNDEDFYVRPNGYGFHRSCRQAMRTDG